MRRAFAFVAILGPTSVLAWLFESRSSFFSVHALSSSGIARTRWASPRSLRARGGSDQPHEDGAAEAAQNDSVPAGVPDRAEGVNQQGHGCGRSQEE